MKLPIVEVEGKKYFVDKKLGELRAVDNPHDTIALEDYEDYIWEKGLDDARDAEAEYNKTRGEDEQD